MTNLFPDFIYATITTYNREKSSSYRIFISTIIPGNILLDDQELEILCPEISEVERNRLLPYCLYPTFPVIYNEIYCLYPPRYNQ